MRDLQPSCPLPRLSNRRQGHQSHPSFPRNRVVVVGWDEERPPHPVSVAGAPSLNFFQSGVHPA
jgi:hypothetical protein